MRPKLKSSVAPGRTRWIMSLDWFPHPRKTLVKVDACLNDHLFFGIHDGGGDMAEESWTSTFTKVLASEYGEYVELDVQSDAS